MPWFRELLVTPECLGCQALGVKLCASCARVLRPRDIQHRSDFTIRCASEYDGWLSERIIDYKNGAAHLARPLAELISPLVSITAVLVPVPTSRAKIRARRFDTVGLLCRELVKIERHRQILPILSLVREVKDQVGLSESGRHANLAHAFMATASSTRDVVVIDDVVTTGATLDEARRALLIAGAHHVSAVALCCSAKKRYG